MEGRENAAVTDAISGREYVNYILMFFCTLLNVLYGGRRSELLLIKVLMLNNGQKKMDKKIEN